MRMSGSVPETRSSRCIGQKAPGVLHPASRTRSAFKARQQELVQELTCLHAVLVVYAVARQSNEKVVELKVVEANAALQSERKEQVSLERTPSEARE